MHLHLPHFIDVITAAAPSGNEMDFSLDKLWERMGVFAKTIVIVMAVCRSLRWW